MYSSCSREIDGTCDYYDTVLDDLIKTIDNLKKENKELKNINDKLSSALKSEEDRIDKAIEYVEKFVPIEEDTILMRETQKEYLLQILKGEDK